MVTRVYMYMLILSLSFSLTAQNKSTEVLFFVDEKKVTNFDFFAVNDSIKSVLKLTEINGLYDISKYLKRYDLYVRYEKHVIRIPKIDYLVDINYIEISHYSSCNKKMFEKRFNKKFINKGINYQVDFGLGDIFFMNYSNQQRKKIRKLLLTLLHE